MGEVVQKRESTGYLIRQRAFLKVILISKIEKGRNYGSQLLDELQTEFDVYGYEPNHAEIYRALHELMEDGILKRTKQIIEGTKYKEIAVYSIADIEKLKAYKKLAKTDLDRCVGMLNKVVRDCYS